MKLLWFSDLVTCLTKECSLLEFLKYNCLIGGHFGIHFVRNFAAGMKPTLFVIIRVNDLISSHLENFTESPPHILNTARWSRGPSAAWRRGGSSRKTILKYICANFKVGEEKSVNVHLKLALKAGVKSGSLKQSKSTGASGSFRLDKVKKAKSAKKAAKPKEAKH